MDQVENAQAEVIERKIGPWTFRRSLKPLVAEIKRKMLRAQWEHQGYYFAVWESELLEDVDDADRRCHRHMIYKEREDDYSFFRWREGGPWVDIVETPRDGSPAQRTTPVRVTHDILTEIRPVTFHVPPVILYVERLGWQCCIIGQNQGRTLEAFIEDIVGRDPCNRKYFNESTAPDDIAKATRLCTRVADQVVDAVVEMSRYKGDRVGGIDQRPSPDIHFTNVHRLGELLPREEVDQNCKDAGMDPHNTVLGPGNVSPRNIVLDKDGNFVGFGFLDWAGFAPREWVQLGLIHLDDRLASDIGRATTVYCDMVAGSARWDRNGVLLLWLNILSEKLVSKGFPKLDAHGLHWLKFKKGDKLSHWVN